MRPYTVKLVDKYFGSIICFLLTIIWTTKKLFKNYKVEKPHKILFIKLIEQGATVLAVPAIKKATEIVGKNNVFFCVFDENRPIIDILNIIPSENIFEFRSSSIWKFVIDIIKFISFCRKNKINTAIDMEFFSRGSAILSYLSGASIRVGYHRFTSEYPYRGNLMTKRVQYNPYLHVSKAYYLLVESLDYKLDEPLIKVPTNNIEFCLPKFIPSEEEKKEIINIISKETGSKTINKPIILINTNASDLIPLRKWETWKFLELTYKIIEIYKNATIIFTGSHSEKQSVEKIVKNINKTNVISVAGKTTLRQLLCLYYISDLLITNDSGPGHFASLTNIKTIILFGPETPYLYAPLSENTYIIWKKLACSPCVNAFNHRFSPCNNNICMQMITVDEVINKIKEILNTKNS